MHQRTLKVSNIRVFPILAVLAILTALALAPVFFTSEAQSKGGGRGVGDRTSSHGDGIPNYDIRIDKNSVVKRGDLRLRDNHGADVAADIRDGAVKAEQRLRSGFPELKVEYAPETGLPEIIGPDAKIDKASISGAKGGNRVETLRSFLRSNNELLGVSAGQIDELIPTADYKNPEGNMSWVILEQKVDGIPVFRGEVVAGFGKDGSLARVVNGLAAGLEPSRLSKEFNDPISAVTSSERHLNMPPMSFETKVNESASTDDRIVYGDADFGVTAEKMYFPLEPGTVIPAWRVLIRQAVASYYVIVDARSGDMLWRKNITEDQTQAANYRVYVNPNAMVNVADSPFPFTPGPTSPAFASQGSAISRTLVSRIGNEAPYQFNNLGWLTDGATTLDGNNVQAGLDRESPNDQGANRANGIDPNGVPTESSSRTYDFPITPATPDPGGVQTGQAPLPVGQSAGTCLATGTAPAPSDFQKAATTQLFYITNVYHDETYRLGFTEQHRNFQHDNFGRGGTGNDRVSAQAQDCNGSNNANFATPADGGRPSMQMYIWTAPAIDIDGSLDADVIIHEITHGLSNRLHSNGSGLSIDFARGMGEGWSDFYGHAMLSEPTDPINGIYSTGAYDTYQLRGAAFANSYYGIRRFPKAVMAFTGGPNNRPHNPMTFQDIDSTKINIADGAYPQAFNSTFSDGVHAIGEVWSSALWEVRARMVQRLGWADGNRRALQFITDGMKLSPVNPNFVTGRDAILAAARAGGTAADVEDVWRGFAVRGVGFSASVQNPGGTSAGGGGLGTIRVTEAFDMPNLAQTPEMTFSDVANGDGDGIAEPGETLQLTIPLTNTTGAAATNVSAQVVGSSTLSYGTIADNGTASNVFNFTLPAGPACGSVVDVTINVNSSLGPISFVRKISTGAPVVTATQNFDGVTAPAFPAGWTVSNEVNGGTNPFVTSTTSSDSAPNAAFAPNPPGATSGQNGATSLTSPAFAIQSASATVSFRHRYNTEAGWDGGVLEISVNGGAYQDIVAAGGSFRQNGYNGFLSDNDNPIDLRNAWTGNSAGFITTVAQLPTSAAGQNVNLRWRFGMDNNTGVEGWFVDTVQVSGQSQCSFVPPSGGANKRSDFDGDGRSDFAVYRATDGNWYVYTSNSQFFGVTWGINGDIPVPADYDNDGKTDVAVYRPGQGGNSSYFYVFNSGNSSFSAIPWGAAGDIPVVRDYDDDGRADFAVYRPSTGFWFVYEADGGVQQVAFGSPGDVPVAGDFDGDGKADFAIRRDGFWYIYKTSTQDISGAGWGVASDIPVPADYDGDGKDDLAIFRPSDGMWWIFRSIDSGVSSIQWGANGDVPVPGDYDGDGKYDPAIYRGGTWWATYSTGGHTSSAFGGANDIPVARRYLP